MLYPTVPKFLSNYPKKGITNLNPKFSNTNPYQAKHHGKNMKNMILNKRIFISTVVWTGVFVNSHSLIVYSFPHDVSPDKGLVFAHFPLGIVTPIF